MFVQDTSQLGSLMIVQAKMFHQWFISYFFVDGAHSTIQYGVQLFLVALSLQVVDEDSVLFFSFCLLVLRSRVFAVFELNQMSFPLSGLKSALFNPGKVTVGWGGSSRTGVGW